LFLAVAGCYLLAGADVFGKLSGYSEAQQVLEKISSLEKQALQHATATKKSSFMRLGERRGDCELGIGSVGSVGSVP
jgi:hypothetical protein